MKMKNSGIFYWAASILGAFSAAYFFLKVLPCIATSRETVYATVSILTMVASCICYVLYVDAKNTEKGS